MKKLVTVLFLVLSGYILQSQDYSYSSYYLINGMSINPAFAGSSEFLNISANLKQQWAGFKGAPSVQTISVDGYNQRLTSGWGVSIVNDMLGASYQQEFIANYSYKIYLEKHELTMGIDAGMSIISANYNELELDDKTDENFTTNESKFYPSAGAGVLLRNENYFIGFSIPSLINGSWAKKYNPEVISRQRSYQLYAGYFYQFDEGRAIKPNLFVRLNEYNSVNIAANAIYYFNDKVGAGLTYYALNSISLLLDVNIIDNLKVLYSVDIATSEIIQYQLGSHELTLRYVFNNSDNYKVVNPRYF